MGLLLEEFNDYPLMAGLGSRIHDALVDYHEMGFD
jgi:hypothetical protein